MALDPKLMDALSARARQETSFVAEIARIRNEPWDAALAAYVVCFQDEAKALLDRAQRARDNRAHA